MEQNKIEKNIKGALEKRSIPPSAKAWNKLEAKLDSDSGVQSLRAYYWIAASVVITIAISTFIFNSENTVAPQVVNTIEKNTIKNDTFHITQKNSVNNTNVIVKPNDENTNKNRQLLKNKKVVKKIETVAHVNEVNKALKSIERIEEQVITFEEQKINEVIKEIQIVKAEKGVTEAEIDLLLLAAQREIDSQKVTDKTKNQLNAMALLQDVENELDKTFKDKVLDLLKQKVIKVVVNKEK